jgi:DNA-binding HxlR family transcriptional regulator
LGLFHQYREFNKTHTLNCTLQVQNESNFLRKASGINYFLMEELKELSTCPVSTLLDVLRDKWALLVLRDMLFAGKST